MGDESEKHFIPFRDDSRKNYGRETTGTTISSDEVKLGAQLRMADSLEKISNTLDTIEYNLSIIRWNVHDIARRPTKEKHEIARLKKQIRGLMETLAERS
jgi:hypothetical protein